MALPFLATFQDAISHLCDFTDALSVESQQRRVRVAIQTAYRELGQAHDWKAYQQHARIQLNAPYTTGTVGYDSASRTVTLSGGTWPAWARFGHLTFTGNTVIYKISERVSGTQVILEPAFCPSADVAAGTGFRIYRSTYPLPGDLLKIREPYDEAGWQSRGRMSPNEWMALERRIGGSEKPFAWTIMGSPELYGQMQIAVHGYPDTAETLDFFYTRSPRPLRLDGYTRYSSMNGATVNSIIGSTVTLSAAVEPDVVGAMFRASVNGASYEPEGIHSPNAYLWQATIYDRPTTTALTLYDAAPSGYTNGSKFTISDPVDMLPYMYNAFLKLAEYELLVKTEPSRANAFRPIRDKALLEARSRDHVEPVPESLLTYRGEESLASGAIMLPTPA